MRMVIINGHYEDGHYENSYYENGHNENGYENDAERRLLVCSGLLASL